jgi:hypothetical protein
LLSSNFEYSCSLVRVRPHLHTGVRKLSLEGFVGEETLKRSSKVNRVLARVEGRGEIADCSAQPASHFHTPPLDKLLTPYFRSLILSHHLHLVIVKAAVELQGSGTLLSFYLFLAVPD